MKDRILRRAVLAFCVVSIGGFFVAFGDGERVAAGSVERTLAPVDAITDAIRSKGSRIVVVDRGSFAEAGLANEARLIDRFGSLSEYVTSGLDRGSDAGLKTSVNLPFGSFDPILSPPAGTIHRDSVVSAGPDYYVVQFGGLVKGDWIDDLESFGVRVLQYVPHQAYLVYADGEAIRKAADHYRVRWVGRYLEESRLPEILRSQVSAARGLSGLAPTISPLSIDDNGMALIDMAIFARADARRIAADLPASLDAKVLNVIELPNNYFNVIRCEVPLSRIEEIANIRDVVRVDFYSRPEPEDERAAQIVAGNYSNTTTLNGPGYNPLTQFGVDGTNVTISMVDDGVSIPGVGGFYISASNTVNGPLRGAAAGATGGHGHLNASIISGAAPFGSLDALNYNYGLGVAPKSNIINIPLLVSGYSGSEANSYDDTVTTSGVNGAKGYISNNSWGNGTNSNVYDSYTAQFDGFVRDASSAATIDPISLVFSAGNSGPAALSLTRPKAAKNLIAVANSENIRTELGSTNADNMDDLRSSSSRGPTGDNRIKPDITAPGSYVTGGRAGNCSSVTSCFDANHAYSIGTSHAAPQVAGAAALFTQFWRNNNVGQNPSPAIIKAAVINTGQDMGGSNVTAPVPNGAEGWGRMNMKLMFPTAVPVKYVDQSAPFFDPGDSVTYTGTVASASQPFRVTLVWTDPPAAAQPALVNNLNLTVTVGGNVYRGNVFSNGSSTTGGTSDSIDNVENVFLPAGIAAGTQVTIQVTAAALNGDGILGNADSTDQHFALVGYNFQQQAAPVSKAVSDFDGDGKSDV
ncbi:MAG: S8 family serine peptidase, partial [Acidobacteria bacterium]|nr:S8 family serine peptidase [Acidobacteriota bacterium]